MAARRPAAEVRSIVRLPCVIAITFVFALAAAPASGSAAFLPDSYDVTEPGLYPITVVRTGDTSGPLTVQLQTVDGQATIADGDYSPILATLTWGPGDTSPRQSILEILDDANAEWLEDLTLELYSPFVEAGVLIDTAVVTVVDDGVPEGPAAEVPTLGEWGLLALAGMLGAAAVLLLRRG